ncbi:FAD binding domain-containing protein [Candidatus Neomarinimicrobiota bacterium]
MQYFQPSTIKEYFKLVQSMSDFALLTGGTDLMPRYEQENFLPEHLVDLKNIGELKGISEKKDTIEIGTITTIREIESSPLIRTEFPALYQSTLDFAGVQIRNRATIGGNICNASPAGDLLPSLYVMNAKLKLVNTKSERLIPIKNFITGPGKTNIKSDEILYSIEIPKHNLKSLFFKIGLRQAMAVAVVNLAIVYDWNSSLRKFNKLNIAAGAVAPTIVYLEKFINTFKKSNWSVEEALAAVTEDISPIDDIRSTAKYRTMVLSNVLRYELNKIMRD